MADDKGFRKMNELVAALVKAQHGLSSGELDVAGLESACADARELYERLVVLRHKAREGKSKVPETSNLASEPAPNAPSIRLDTRPAEVPRQTSLIEAIEATEQAEVPAAQVEPMKAPTTPDAASGKKSGTLAERMEKASIPDLGKAISLSHKFWFVAELFNGDRTTYDKSIEVLNGMSDHAAAKAFIDTEVIAKLKKPADPEALSTFTELVQRRYS